MCHFYRISKAERNQNPRLGVSGGGGGFGSDGFLAGQPRVPGDTGSARVWVKPAGTTMVQVKLVAIVGGSGSGKTWLAGKLLAALAPDAAGLSLDDFYLDRSHLSPARRARLNFDHPRAIDWAGVEQTLHALRAGRAAPVPCYDFKTHSRLPGGKVIKPKPIVLVEGLWLLHRRALRRLFALRLFLECPGGLRLRRRLARDLVARGRTRAAVRAQFQATVEPMHRRFVAPQIRWADLVLPSCCREREVEQIVARLRG
jgi:uridine kinase